jgi:type IV secretory pathway VirB3-like protein
MGGEHKVLTTGLTRQAKVQGIQMSFVRGLLNMLELIDVVIRKVLLEWTSYIIRLFALLLTPITSNLNILVALTWN